jgi:hypothetical protein
MSKRDEQRIKAFGMSNQIVLEELSRVPLPSGEVDPDLRTKKSCF